jgi:hypothetical protein
MPIPGLNILLLDYQAEAVEWMRTMEDKQAKLTSNITFPSHHLP